MPLKTDSFWTGEILSIKADNPLWGAQRIRRELDETHGDRQDIPDARTVGRILKREWEPLSAEERLPYERLYWPEACFQSYLPWEASAACLELLGRVFTSASTGLGEKRPTIRLARAFWRITLATPDLSADRRLRYARKWSAWETLGNSADQQFLRNLEHYLAYAPWRTPEAAAAANKAHNAGEFDMSVPLITLAGEYKDSLLLEALTELSGSPSLAEAVINYMEFKETGPREAENDNP